MTKPNKVPVTGIGLIALYRLEHIYEYGHTVSSDHSKMHGYDELKNAAMAIIMQSLSFWPASVMSVDKFHIILGAPKRDQLAIAGAFLAAAIDLISYRQNLKLPDFNPETVVQWEENVGIAMALGVTLSEEAPAATPNNTIPMPAGTVYTEADMLKAFEAGKVVERDLANGRTAWTFNGWFKEYNEQGTSETIAEPQEQPIIEKKPPIGLRPQFIHLNDRMTDIVDAMNRYKDAMKLIPEAWFKELKSISEQYAALGYDLPKDTAKWIDWYYKSPTAKNYRSLHIKCTVNGKQYPIEEADDAPVPPMTERQEFYKNRKALSGYIPNKHNTTMLSAWIDEQINLAPMLTMPIEFLRSKHLLSMDKVLYTIRHERESGTEHINLAKLLFDYTTWYQAQCKPKLNTVFTDHLTPSFYRVKTAADSLAAAADIHAESEPYFEDGFGAAPNPRLTGRVRTGDKNERERERERE